MVKQYKKSKSDLDKVVTLGLLLEFTDDFLIPKMSEMMDEKIKTGNALLEEKIKTGNANLEHNLKSYIDDKLANYTSDIFKRLDKKYQKEKQFKEKVVELFKKHNIGSKEDLAFLEGLVAGS